MEQHSEPTPATAPPRLTRAEGQLHVAFKRRGSATVLDTLYQQGCLKARFPAVHEGGVREGVLINTAGGLTDGDRLTQRIDWGAGTHARITSQAAERIYRSRLDVARIDTALNIGAGAEAHWLPQETILFDGGRLTRRNRIEMQDGSRLVAAESLVAGRHAMAETVRGGQLIESWRIRYDGHLVFADGLRLEGDIDAQLSRPGIANGARALATLIYVGADAGERHQALAGAAQAAAGEGVRAACSLLPLVLVARVLAADGAGMRAALMALMKTLVAGTAGDRLPRVWLC